MNELNDNDWDDNDDWHRSPDESETEQQGLLIPAETISVDALEGLIEEFVSRDGTDYGASEVSFATRIEQVQKQIARGDVSVVFDIATQTANLVLTRDLSRMNLINGSEINSTDD